MTLRNTRCHGQQGDGCISQALHCLTYASVYRDDSMRTTLRRLPVTSHFSLSRTDSLPAQTSGHVSFSAQTFLKHFRQLVYFSKKLLRSRMSYLLHCAYSPPSVCFSMLITLNLSPRWFCCELVL